MINMKILFAKHNVTTDLYLSFLAKESEVYVCHHKRALTGVPEGAIEIPVKYQPAIVGRVFGLLKVPHMYPQLIPYFNKILNEASIDNIIVGDFYDFIFAQAVAYKKKQPDTKIYVWSETRAWPKFWFTRWVMYGFWWYFKRNLKYVEKVFVFSEEGKNFFVKHVPEVVVEVFPAAVDTKKFFPDDEKTFKPDNTLRILMNVRFIPLKDHKTLFKALKILDNKGVNFKLSLIGRGGHLKNELLEYAEELGIGKFIKVIESVPHEQLRDIYINHDALVLPSYREAIGMVVPEAMACGLPTVTSSVIGANTYVREGETGFIFKVGDAEDLADKLLKLSSSDILKSFGDKASEIIEQKYSVEILGEKFQREIGVK